MNRLRLSAAALVVLAVTLGSGCFPQVPEQPCDWEQTPEGAVQMVRVAGDSLTARASEEARAVFGQDPNLAACYRAFGMTRVQHWFDVLDRVGPTEDAVVALGTNNVTLDGSSEETEGYVRQAADSLRDARCQVWLTLNTTGGDQRGEPYASRTRAVNALLRELDESDEYPNLHLFDWEALSAGHPGWLEPDHVHHLDEGDEFYAFALREAALGCRS